MNALAESFARSPELFPHAVDLRNDALSFIRLSKRDYENASFLDGRILTISRSIPWSQVLHAVQEAGLVESCHFIFHIGHVGSTLISRLLGAHPGIFALREPSVLRAFAQSPGEPAAQHAAWSTTEFDLRLAAFLKLVSRTFDKSEHALVKATSFVSEFAATLLTRPCAPKALLMFVKPEVYLATVFGGPNSLQESKILAESRLTRLQSRLGGDNWRLAQFGAGEIVAMAWACEMTALLQAAEAAGDSTLALDFEAFLVDPADRLSRAFRHLDVEADAAAINAILAGPHMGRYSKAPEHAYDAALRRDVLNRGRAMYRSEIRRGLDWLDRAAAEFESVRRAMEFAG